MRAFSLIGRDYERCCDRTLSVAGCRIAPAHSNSPPHDRTGPTVLSVRYLAGSEDGRARSYKLSLAYIFLICPATSYRQQLHS